MAKKPKNETPVKVPNASKKTKDAIAFFNDKKPATDLFETPDGRKKLKLSPAAGKPPRKPLFEGAFKWMEGKGQFVTLGITTAVICAVIYWMMVQ